MVTMLRSIAPTSFSSDGVSCAHLVPSPAPSSSQPPHTSSSRRSTPQKAPGVVLLLFPPSICYPSPKAFTFRARQVACRGCNWSVPVGVKCPRRHAFNISREGCSHRFCFSFSLKSSLHLPPLSPASLASRHWHWYSGLGRNCSRSWSWCWCWGRWSCIVFPTPSTGRRLPLAAPRVRPSSPQMTPKSAWIAPPTATHHAPTSHPNRRNPLVSYTLSRCPLLAACPCSFWIVQKVHSSSSCPFNCCCLLSRCLNLCPSAFPSLSPSLWLSIHHRVSLSLRVALHLQPAGGGWRN